MDYALSLKRDGWGQRPVRQGWLRRSLKHSFLPDLREFLQTPLSVLVTPVGYKVCENVRTRNSGKRIGEFIKPRGKTTNGEEIKHKSGFTHRV